MFRPVSACRGYVWVRAGLVGLVEAAPGARQQARQARRLQRAGADRQVPQVNLTTHNKII